MGHVAVHVHTQRGHDGGGGRCAHAHSCLAGIPPPPDREQGEREPVMLQHFSLHRLADFDTPRSLSFYGGLLVS